MDFQYLKEKESTKRFHLKKKPFGCKLFFLSVWRHLECKQGEQGPQGGVSSAWEITGASTSSKGESELASLQVKSKDGGFAVL